MEDSHITNLDIGDGIAVFGVFDGHGGIRTVIKNIPNR
jgi:serine/threonine protein phosphatase PrpC